MCNNCSSATLKAIKLIKLCTGKDVILESKDEIGVLEITCSFEDDLQESDEQEVDITKVDINKIQKDVIDTFFPNEGIPTLPFKFSSNKQWSGMFRTRFNRNTKELIEPHFIFNKLNKWTYRKIKGVVAHEVIHYVIAFRGDFKEGHGPKFQKEMNRINSSSNEYHVTIKDEEFVMQDEMENKIVGFFYLIYLKDGRKFYMCVRKEETFETTKHILVSRYDVEKIEKYMANYKATAEYGVSATIKPSVYAFNNPKNYDELKERLKYIGLVYNSVEKEVV